MIGAARSFLLLPAADRALLVRSVCWLVPFRVLLWTRPYATVRRLADRWGRDRGAAGVAPARVAWAVETAARVVPGASCLTQALAAEVVLRRAGEDPSLRFGVRAGEGDFEAHAWLELAGRTLVGERGLERFTRLERDVVVGPAGAPVDSAEP